MKISRLGLVLMTAALLTGLTTCDTEEYVPEDDPCSEANEEIHLIDKRLNGGFEHFTLSQGLEFKYFNYSKELVDVCAGSSVKFEFNVFTDQSAVIIPNLYVDGKLIRMNRKQVKAKDKTYACTFGDFYWDVEKTGDAVKRNVKVKIELRFLDTNFETALDYFNKNVSTLSLKIKFYQITSL